MQNTNTTLKISPRDNLLVALSDLAPSQQIITDSETITLCEKIPAKHKFAATKLAIGDLAFMYGVLVGEAIKPIIAGERITTENLVHLSLIHISEPTRPY